MLRDIGGMFINFIDRERLKLLRWWTCKALLNQDKIAETEAFYLMKYRVKFNEIMTNFLKLKLLNDELQCKEWQNQDKIPESEGSYMMNYRVKHYEIRTNLLKLKLPRWWTTALSIMKSGQNCWNSSFLNDELPR